MSTSNITKGVLLSSNSNQARSQSSEISSSAASDLVENRLKFEHSIDHNIVLLHVEAHKKRLKKLRKELNYLQETAWKYQSIEKILVVLTPNGRRQNVKITPNTTLLQVLEEVCSKHGFKPEDYDIRHHNKILDVSSIFRYTGLPNNALLEMTEAKTQRSESSVVLGLHLESGDRLTGEFTPSDNLWDIILSLSPEAKSFSSPVVIYMRKEVHGRENLQKTTLRSLGLTGGRAILRFFNRPSEELRTQANVSTVLSRPAEIKDKNTVTKAPDQQSKERDLTRPAEIKDKNTVTKASDQQSKERDLTRPAEIKDKNTDPKTPDQQSKERDLSPRPKLRTTEKNEPKEEKEEKQKSSPSAVKKVNEKPKQLEEKTKTSEDKKVERVIDKDPKHNIKNNAVKDDSAKNAVEKHVSQPSAKNLPKESEEPQSNVILLGERSAVAYTMNKVKPVVVEEEPDDFYELTVSDAKLLLRDAKQLCADLENAPLMTSAQRELEKNKKILCLLNQYKKTVLRIKFPDRTVLQGTFSSVEKVSAVEKFVAEYLENPDVSFYLYTTPPKEILQSDKNLLESNCVPCAILYFGIRSEMEKSKQFLRSDVIEKFSSPSAAALMAFKSRGLVPNKIHEDKESDGEDRNIIENDSVSIAGPSTSPSPSEVKPRREQENSPPFKVPKWFKIKK